MPPTECLLSACLLDCLLSLEPSLEPFPRAKNVIRRKEDSYYCLYLFLSIITELSYKLILLP